MLVRYQLDQRVNWVTKGSGWEKLVKGSLHTPEDPSSNSADSNFCKKIYFYTVLHKEKEAGNGPFLKNWLTITFLYLAWRRYFGHIRGKKGHFSSQKTLKTLDMKEVESLAEEKKNLFLFDGLTGLLAER